MSNWTSDELKRIGSADELELSAAGRTVTIWVVRVGNDLFVRSYRGRDGRWFRRAQGTRAARIRAGGVERDVGLVESHDADDAIDDAYRAKYERSGAGFVATIVAPGPRATTLKLVPPASG